MSVYGSTMGLEQEEDYRKWRKEHAMETTSTVSGIVTRTNGTGFCIDGHEGWLNVSKYAKPAPMIPAKGQAVNVGLDKAGFVRTIEPLPQAPVTPESQAPASSNEPQETTEDRKQRLIVRQCVLKVAADLATIGQMAEDVPGVLSIAEQLEAWVLR